MKKAGIFLLIVIAMILSLILFDRNRVITIDKTDEFDACATEYAGKLVENMNEELLVTVGGATIEEFGYDFYISDSMKLMVEDEFLKSLVCCSVERYSDGRILVMRGNNTVGLQLDSDEATINNLETVSLGNAVYKDEKTGNVMIPFNEIAQYLGYTVDTYLSSNWVDLVAEENGNLLPAAYDMRDYERVSPVRDQGRYGTCWAFASLGALETTLLPEEKNIFSVDHMSLCNSYNLDLNKGGEHTMSIAYLAAWQGPVLESEDPYGDGESDSSLKAVKHLEEALVLNEKDIDTLKSAIFRYGGIETSLYSQMEYVDSVSQYYSRDNFSYYYDGEETPNHDVVVVGWDDNYPKESFTTEPEGDGAFICKNSWGESFGDNGFFYVSYYDANICNKSVVYTRVGNADNYDKIYQSDLLGWIGQMGFGKEDAYFANVYTAGEKEELAAVSFYATGKNTEFEVYVVKDFKDTNSFENREFVTAGSTQYAGYYTVDFPKSVRLKDNSDYAVVVKIKTPGTDHPIAIEYNADERTANFDISDGRGYISLYGEMWHSAENAQNCNVCLKAFTNFVSGDEDSSDEPAANEPASTAATTEEGATDTTEKEPDIEAEP